MNIRAVIFDVYGTLLEVGPPPPDAEAAWDGLWREMLQIDPPLSRLDFLAACSDVVSRQHEVARACGIAIPEVYWPSIVAQVVPEIAFLREEKQQEFLLRQVRTGHTTRLSRECAEVLRWLRQNKYLLGIASNAQSYTLRELQEALAHHELNLEIFERELCFWSFKHGFSKPDSHVFQILSARLEADGISKNQILMVGDRLDNDIKPAQAHGWKTWQLCSPGQAGSSGWAQLLTALSGQTAP